MEAVTTDRAYALTQYQLMWRKFKRHRLAIVASIVLLLFYALVVFAEVIAPVDPGRRLSKFPLAPPQRIHFIDAEGRFHLRPFVYGLEPDRDPVTLRRRYRELTAERYPISFLVHGDRYKLWSWIDADLHLFGIGTGEVPFFLLGSDDQGRDLLSRIVYAARISLTLGLLGVALSFVMGISIGSISGYAGGVPDVIIQRLIEILRSYPSLPLWMALSAALPLDWPVVRTYFFITIILSLTGWTDIARQVRGKYLSLREEQFVQAAKVANAGTSRILFIHLLPSFLSHIIATASLSIPAMILGETALSFLGLGLRAPAISWGVLLQNAQNVRAVAHTPWLLLPAVFVIVSVLAFNFVGDGLRDAADPYH